MRKIFFFIVVLYLTLSSNAFPQDKPPASRLFKILKDKEITISVSADYEPYYIANPKEGYPGFEVELAYKLADYLGVKVKEIVPLQYFADHAEAVNSGRVDIALGNSSNMKRGKFLNFSDPYYITSSGALVNKLVLPPEQEGGVVSNKSFRNLLDLKNVSGLVMGVKERTYNLEFIEENFKNRARIKVFKTDEAARLALVNNEINCFVSDNLFLEGLMQKYPSFKAQYQALLSPIVEKQQSIGMRKYDPYLMVEMNFFVREMKRTGEINRLKEKYFNTNAWVLQTEE